ncbi:MAG: hypothetical protein M3347_13375 [Armatimonadota bacterium]|nr:hypothetical protein [Armatimonadota bacterium]
MKWLLTLWVLVVALLHQDFWWWKDKTLVFGFLPVGLAYHVFYAFLASLTMWILVRFAWPSHLERFEPVDEPSAAPSSSVDGGRP